MKKILVISWFFPPVISSEGMVTYKLLASSQYEYDVFTQNSNIQWSYGNNDLEIPENINCIYSKSNTLKDYINNAVNYFEENKEKYDIVMTRSMPPESHVIGLKIKEIKPSIKLISSFGDPIANSPFVKINNLCYITEVFNYKKIYNPRYLYGFLKRKRVYHKYVIKVNEKDELLEKNILENADMIILNNQFQKDYMFKEVDEKQKEKIKVLPHSYYSNFYNKKSKDKNNSKKIFAFLGHLDEIRSPKSLFEAIKLLNQKQSGLSEKVEFVFYGNMALNDKIYLIDNDLLEIVKIKKPISYLAGMDVMKNANYLINIDANISAICNDNIYFAAKIADYIGSGTPIIGITMLDGASADILRKTNNLVLSHSVDEIYNYLYMLINDLIEIKPDKTKCNDFNSVVVSKKFDDFVKEI